MAESFTPNNFTNGQQKEITIRGDIDLSSYTVTSVTFQQDGQPPIPWNYSDYHVQPDHTMAKVKVTASAQFSPILDPVSGTLTITLTGGGGEEDTLPVSGSVTVSPS
jgi:hypothetical protein